MDIPQLQAELAAKADEVLRTGHRCKSSVFDGEAKWRSWDVVRDGCGETGEIGEIGCGKMWIFFSRHLTFGHV